MSSIHIRHWRAGDDPEVMRILAPTGWCTPERYDAKFDDPGLRPEDILIAEQAGRVVGHLMLPHRRLRFGQALLPLGGIGMVVVDPDQRGQGLGARLLTAALEHHRRAGNVLAGLYTNEALVPAYEMYQRRGFVPVTERVILELPLPLPLMHGALPQVRPLQPADRAGLLDLLAAAATHSRGISTDGFARPATAMAWVADGSDGGLIGYFEITTGAQGQMVQRLLALPPASPASLLATAVALGALAPEGDIIRLSANTGSSTYAALAVHARGQQRDGARFLLAPLHFGRILADLSVELAARLREADAAPVTAWLRLVETGEQLGFDWQAGILTVHAGGGTDAAVPVTTADLMHGLMGQPASAPRPDLAALWAALFPPAPIEMGLVNCW